MIAADLWIPRSKRLKRPYQPRYNRDCFGELIQIDGSHHDWFEGRAAKCCLLVFIDDATGKLQHLRFCESESTFDYMISTRLYVEQHGKPLAFYSDKHSVFRVNQSSKKDTKITQFGRVLSTLKSISSSLIHRRPKAVWNVLTEPFRIVWSRRCTWNVSVRLSKLMPGYPASLSSSIRSSPSWLLILRIHIGLSLKQPKN